MQSSTRPVRAALQRPSTLAQLRRSVSGVRSSLCSMPLLALLLALPAHADRDAAATSFHAVPLTAALRAGDAAVPVPLAAFEPTPDPAVLQQQLAQLEASEGPYAPALAAVTEQLGRTLQQLDRHEEAIALFGRSRQILRIHAGPFNLDQLPVVEAMIDSNLVLGRLQDADNLHATRFHLQLRALGENNPAAVTAYLDWADWNVQRYLDTRNPDDAALQARLISTRLETAHQACLAALALLQNSGPAPLDTLVATERRIAGLSFLVNRDLQQDSHSSLTRLGDRSRQRSRQTPSSQLFNEGTLALKRAISYSIEAPQAELAVTRMLELGDWYLLLDERHAALEAYEQALAVLDAASVPAESLPQLLGSGLPLQDPASNALALSAALQSGHDGYIDVEFKVNRYGKAGNPKILASSAEREVEKALLEQIRSGTFRPAFEDGTAVAQRGVQLRYYYSR